MNENFSEELKKELVKQAIKSLDDPFKMLTVKDVAKDLYMGENKTKMKYLIVQTSLLLI